VVFDGPLAQLVEQLTLNQLVVGSIPTRPTIYRKQHKNPYKSVTVGTERGEGSIQTYVASTLAS
jgi:hypothetical protein